MPWEIQKERAPRANEHPNVIGVDKREHQDVCFAFVVRAVAAPAGPLVEKLFPSVDGGSLYHGILVEVVADFCARNFHHFVDEHVIVTARKIDKVTEPAHFEEQVFFIGEACGACNNRATETESGCFHPGIAERFELLIEVWHGTCAVVLLGPLHDADVIDESPCHRSNPALAWDAVGVHREEYFVFGNFEGAFEGAFFGTCDLRKVLREAEYAELRVRRGKLFQNFAGGVRGTVIDANHFPFAYVVLYGEGFERALGEFLFVSHRDDYRNARGRFGAFIAMRL